MFKIVNTFEFDNAEFEMWDFRPTYTIFLGFTCLCRYSMSSIILIITFYFFKAIDDTSGDIAAILISVNNVSMETQTRPSSLQEGVHSLVYEAVDEAGNIGVFTMELVIEGMNLSCDNSSRIITHSTNTRHVCTCLNAWSFGRVLSVLYSWCFSSVFSHSYKMRHSDKPTASDCFMSKRWRVWCRM